MKIEKLLKYLDGKHKCYTQEANKLRAAGDIEGSKLCVGMGMAIVDILNDIVEDLDENSK